eukprot:9486203-Pyramimonas_sp.AAC.2
MQRSLHAAVGPESACRSCRTCSSRSFPVRTLFLWPALPTIASAGKARGATNATRKGAAGEGRQRGGRGRARGPCGPWALTTSRAQLPPSPFPLDARTGRGQTDTMPNNKCDPPPTVASVGQAAIYRTRATSAATPIETY